MNTKMFDDKPPPLPTLWSVDAPPDPHEARKRRWKLRRLVYGGTGAPASCTDLITPYFILLCKQRRLHVDSVMRHLRRLGV